jgi:hypothetical protein
MLKKTLYAFVQNKLSTERVWQVKALIAIFNRQTETEKQVESTLIHNDIGFTGCDGQILASFAKQWLSRKWLSEKQYYLLGRRIPRYWKQIYELSDKNKLHDQALLWVEAEIALRNSQSQLELNLANHEMQVK